MDDTVAHNIIEIIAGIRQILDGRALNLRLELVEFEALLSHRDCRWCDIHGVYIKPFASVEPREYAYPTPRIQDSRRRITRQIVEA